MNKTIEELFKYDDYREFLKDFFSEQKRLQKVFSYRYFAAKSGFSSASFLVFILKGERNLSFKSIQKILQGLSLKGKSAKYFESLVLYNQTNSSEDKEKLFIKLNKLKKNSIYGKISKRQYSLYDKWYYQVIREVATIHEWNNNYKILAKLVRPSITEKEAKQALETLVSINLLKEKDGKFYQTKEAISAEGIPSFVIKKTRTELINRAAEAAELMSPNERFITGTTLSVGKDAYSEITEIINDAREKIAKVAMHENMHDIDKVYQFNIQLFPLSQSLTQREGK